MADKGSRDGDDHLGAGRAASGHAPDGSAAPASRTVEVIDMVGAGGACMSALLAGLHRRGLLGAARRFMLEGLGHAARTEPLR